MQNFVLFHFLSPPMRKAFLKPSELKTLFLNQNEIWEWLLISCILQSSNVHEPLSFVLSYNVDKQRLQKRFPKL